MTVARVQVSGPDFHCCGQPMERGAVVVWVGYSLGPFVGGQATAQARRACIYHCNACGQEAFAIIPEEKTPVAEFSIREPKE